MTIQKLSDMTRGWFIGNFDPSVIKTEQFEVGSSVHPKGQKWDVHYHKVATEITYLISGRMRIQDKEIVAGDLFVIPPYEIADPEFLEDCHVLIVKIPSVIGDKYVVRT